MRGLRRRGPVFTEHGRLWLATLLTAGLALTFAIAAIDPAPNGEGRPIPTQTPRGR